MRIFALTVLRLEKGHFDFLVSVKECNKTMFCIKSCILLSIASWRWYTYIFYRYTVVYVTKKILNPESWHWGMTNLNRLIYLKYQQRHWTRTNLQGKHPIQEDSQPRSSASSPAAWEKANQKRAGEFGEHSGPWSSQPFKVMHDGCSLK